MAIQSEREAMSETSKPMVTMYDVLREIGFTPDPTIISNDPGGLALRFGSSFELEAIHGLIEGGFERQVLLTGQLNSGRSISVIEEVLPERVESRELGLALFAYQLEDDLKNERVPAPLMRWLIEGHRHRRLIPGVLELEEMEERPRCSVDPDWLRPLLRRLRAILAGSVLPEFAEFSFNGKTLVVTLGPRVLPAMAAGKPWEHAYRLSAAELARSLPVRRLPGSDWFEVVEGELRLGRHVLGSATEVSSTAGAVPLNQAIT